MLVSFLVFSNKITHRGYSLPLKLFVFLATDGAQESKETGDQSAAKSSAAGAVTDPYHYLTREHFTSEIFKIELKNLPRHFGFAVSITNARHRFHKEFQLDLNSFSACFLGVF